MMKCNGDVGLGDAASHSAGESGKISKYECRLNGVNMKNL